MTRVDFGRESCLDGKFWFVVVDGYDESEMESGRARVDEWASLAIEIRFCLTRLDITGACAAARRHNIDLVSAGEALVFVVDLEKWLAQ